MLFFFFLFCSVSGPGGHSLIIRWCGMEQVLLCSNPVPTLDRGQPRPIIWVPNPHSLRPTRRISMPIKENNDTNIEDNEQSTDTGGTNYFMRWGTFSSLLCETKDLVIFNITPRYFTITW